MGNAAINGAARRHWGALATISGVTVFLAIVVSLHFLQPGYDPRYKLMSELARGPYGLAMLFAFLGLAAAVFGVQAALGSYGARRGYRALLGIAALLFLMAGVFPLGKTTTIHVASIALAFLFSVLAMYLFPSGAGRASIAAPPVLSWTLAAGVAVSVALGQSILPIGIGQRLAAGCLLLWLTILAWRLPRRRRHEIEVGTKA